MQFPTKCPHCGKDVAENLIDAHYGPIYNEFNGIAMQIHECIHCKAHIYVFRTFILANGIYAVDPNNVISYYPKNHIIDFPKHIKTLSPESCKIYSDTCNAYKNGFNSLVGAGLRMALEWLVWDYLIKFKQIPQSDIENLSLAQRLEKMDANLYTGICTKLIRRFGNDQVHIIKKLDFEFNEIFNAYEILCDLINNELELIEIQKRLNS